MDNLTVILRNRNEEEYIGFAIQSVLDHYPNAEILIIDNESTDASIEIACLFNKASISIHTISKLDYSPGRALNLAAKAASNDTLLVLSAHSQITNSWSVDRLKSYLRDYPALFGMQTPIYRGKKITKRYIWSHFTEEEQVNMYSSIEDRYFLHNAFCFYNRDYLLANPFDETLAGKEDRYWAIDTVARGDSYLYTPELQANHYWTKNGATWKGIG